MTEDCIFCRIISGEIPAQILYRDEYVTVIPDARPAANIHLLILSNEHYPMLEDFPTEITGLLAAIYRCVRQLALENNLSEAGYRLILNNGKAGGQTIGHFHLHLLGGGPLPKFIHG